MTTNEMTAKVTTINEAIEQGMPATCQSHPRNHGLPIEYLTTGNTAKIKGFTFVFVYSEDIERLHALAQAFLAAPERLAQVAWDEVDERTFDSVLAVLIGGAPNESFVHETVRPLLRHIDWHKVESDRRAAICAIVEEVQV